MFKTLSSSERQPKGKLQTEQSYQQKLTNYSIGCKEWDSQWKTMNSIFLEQKSQEKPFVIDKTNTRKSHFTIGSQHLQGKINQYESEKTQNYQNFYPGHEKRNPVLSRQDLTKTNYQLGNNERQFNTTNKDYDQKRQETVLPDIQFKKDRVRFDIIKNVDINQKQLQEKALAFDFYNPEKYKGRITKDYSHIPRAGERRVDPITGRRLKF